MTITVKIEISDPPMANEIRDWLYKNVGQARLDHTWSVTVRQKCYVFEFANGEDAALFLLRWR